ncbi:MAG: glycoside hydrolase family 88 protein [Clostridia bacterium]|nr:glycoside hydrolase family 88 protein [Clostridia bacterium]
MTGFIIAFLTVGLVICLAVIGCDLLPVFFAWLGRIHIGRHEEKEWAEKTEEVAMKWIGKLPAMPVSDNNSFTIVPRLKGEYSNKKFNCWQEACLLLGIKDNEEAKKSAYTFFKSAELEKQEYTPGTAMLLYALLESGFEKDPEVASACVDYCKKTLAAAGMGTLPYNRGSDNRYVDVLGMVCPFLIKYSQVYGSVQAMELAKKQIDEYYRYGVHIQTGLPVHCFSERTKAPLGVYGWGRGCAWLAISLAESFSLLNGKDEYADVLKERMINLADVLKRYQNKSGGFSSMLGTDAREDSSATAMIGWFFARAYEASGNEAYEVCAKSAKKYLISVTRRDGKVDFAQGDTMGIGNYSRRFEPLPTAQGFALRLYKEIG